MTLFDGAAMTSNVDTAAGTSALLVSGVVLHSLPAGARFDLGTRTLLPGAGGTPDDLRPPPEPRRPAPAARPADRDRGRSRGPPQAPRRQEVGEPRGPARSRPDHPLDQGLPRAELWSYDPAVHLQVDLGLLEEFPTDLVPGFTDALLRLLPGVGDHSCSRRKAGGFVERLHEGTWLGHVAEHVALELQRQTGAEVSRGKTRGTAGRTGVYDVIFSYADETVGVAAGKLAVRLVNHLVQSEDGFDPATPRSSGWCCSPSAPRSAPPPSPSSTRRSAATSPGCG